MEALTDKIKAFLTAGDGYGSGYGSGYGDGSGDGYGDGSGSGDGSGYGDCSGSGSGYGYGDGIGEIEGKQLYLIDGIPTALLSIKCNVAKGAILRDDLTWDSCFIAKGNGMFAHGPSLREAMAALTDKLFDGMPEEERITAFVKEHPDFTKNYPNRDLYDWHHKLTGSCEMGRNNFVRENALSLDGNMSIAEFVLLTQNAYGGSTIKKLPEAYRQRKNL